MTEIMTTKKKSLFSAEIDFCPDCGSILPLPASEDFVSCRTCSYKVDVREFDGVEIHSQVIFNERKLKTSTTTEKTDGPLVDRKCSKCGHEGMGYHTLQTRSADEGQTVFYSCPNCGVQETEFS